MLYEPSAVEVEQWRKQQTNYFEDVDDESSDEEEQEEVQEHDSDSESMCSSIEISRGRSMMPVNRRQSTEPTPEGEKNEPENEEVIDVGKLAEEENNCTTEEVTEMAGTGSSTVFAMPVVRELRDWRKLPPVMELEIWNKKTSIQRKVDLYARLRDPRVKLYLDYSVTYDENRQKEEERRRLLVRLQVPPGDCAWENMRRGRSLLLEKIWTYDAQQKIVPRFPLTCEADYCRERDKKFEWDCETDRILREYGLCHAPSNWRRLSIVRELEQCITRRTNEYSKMKDNDGNFSRENKRERCFCYRAGNPDPPLSA